MWSTDGKWIAVNDQDDFDASRCILADTAGGVPVDVSDLAARLPAITRELHAYQHVACEVFGWVQGTSRVALNIWVAGGRAPGGFFRGYFLDTSTWTFTDSRTTIED